MKRLLILFFLFPLMLLAQTSGGFLMKTLIFQDVFYHNPNLIVEKILDKNHTVELLLALRYGDWLVSGGKGLSNGLPHRKICNGYTVGLTGKYYFSGRKAIPNSWFVSGILRYNKTTIENAYLQSGSYSRHVDLTRNGPEAGLAIGRQWLMFKHISSEIYFGGGTYYQHYKEEYISGAEDKVQPEQSFFVFRPYLGLTLGFMPGKNLFRNAESDGYNY